jgi:peptidoglycan/xylan/chitin deacetylase (PgdA/CDA1 family)
MAPVVKGLRIPTVFQKISSIVFDDSVAILMYHRVAKPPAWADGLSIKTFSATPEQFEEHLLLIRSRYNVLSLEDYLELCDAKKKVSPKSIIITFDDGYLDNYTYAFPLLKKYNLPATVFVTTGFVNSCVLPWWDRVKWHLSQTSARQIELNSTGLFPLTSIQEKHAAIYAILGSIKLMQPERIEAEVEYLIRQLGRDPQDEPRERLFLSWNEIREMNRNRIGIGAHTVSHPNLASIKPGEAADEIVGSKAMIESELKTSVSTFAYPFGQAVHYNEDVKETVRAAGFRCALTIEYGRHKATADPFRMRRIPVFTSQNCDVLHMKLTGMFDKLAGYL